MPLGSLIIALCSSPVIGLVIGFVDVLGVPHEVSSPVSGVIDEVLGFFG